MLNLLCCLVSFTYEIYCSCIRCWLSFVLELAVLRLPQNQKNFFPFYCICCSCRFLINRQLVLVCNCVVCNFCFEIVLSDVFYFVYSPCKQFFFSFDLLHTFLSPYIFSHLNRFFLCLFSSCPWSACLRFQQAYKFRPSSISPKKKSVSFYDINKKHLKNCAR